MLVIKFKDKVMVKVSKTASKALDPRYGSPCRVVRALPFNKIDLNYFDRICSFQAVDAALAVLLNAPDSRILLVSRSGLSEMEIVLRKIKIKNLEIILRMQNVGQ